MPISRSIPLLALVATVGCGDSLGSNLPSGHSGNNQPAFYDVTVGGLRLVGNSGVESNWKPEIGLIYLGTDAVAQPLGTMTITIGESVGPTKAEIVSATVSTTLRRVGTAPELDARLWQVDPNLARPAVVTNLLFDEHFVQGDFEIALIQMLPPPPAGQAADTTTLKGVFRAVAK